MIKILLLSFLAIASARHTQLDQIEELKELVKKISETFRPWNKRSRHLRTPERLFSKLQLLTLLPSLLVSRFQLLLIGTLFTQQSMG